MRSTANPGGRWTIAVGVVLALAVALMRTERVVGEAGAKASTATANQALPIAGTQIAELPNGAGKLETEKACLKCHSADILRQQRLTEKQWTASVTKMLGWGAELAESDKSTVIGYLARSFGPSNDAFQPVATRPIGR